MVRTDGEVAEAKVFVHADGSITFTCPDRSGPPGQMNPNQEGVCWARGEWDSEAVVALRALAALGASC